MIESAALTLIAGAWRFLDGRGIPRAAWARNVIGLALALVCAYTGMGMTWQAGVCAAIAWTCLIAGYTDWREWWSLARYGGPTVAISVLGYLGGAPPVPCALYATGGVLVGLLYIVAHRYVPDTGWNTPACETAAGAVIIGGLAWL